MINRSFADRLTMDARLIAAREKKGASLTTDEQRKAGYTPPGFKSSQPKAER